MRELAASNPSDFIAAFPDGAIIDEAQKVPEIFDALKMHVDNSNFTPGQFILTGSSQFRLKQNMSDSMAGRAAFLKLLPFSVKELKDEGVLTDNPYDIIFGGQYPPLHDPKKHFILKDWYENYIDTYLDLDVRDQINADNLSTFKKFIQICAVYSGQLLSIRLPTGNTPLLLKLRVLTHRKQSYPQTRKNIWNCEKITMPETPFFILATSA